MLVGAGVPDRLHSQLEKRLEALGYPADYAERLIGRYGTEAQRVVGLLEEDPSTRATLGTGDVTAAEVVYVIREESATSIADVTLRRTHLAWSVPDHGRADAAAISAILTRELEWSGGREQRAIEQFERDLVAEGL